MMQVRHSIWAKQGCCKRSGSAVEVKGFRASACCKEALATGQGSRQQSSSTPVVLTSQRTGVILIEEVLVSFSAADMAVMLVQTSMSGALIMSLSYVMLASMTTSSFTFRSLVTSVKSYSSGTEDEICTSLRMTLPVFLTVMRYVTLSPAGRTRHRKVRARLLLGSSSSRHWHWHVESARLRSTNKRKVVAAAGPASWRCKQAHLLLRWCR